MRAFLYNQSKVPDRPERKPAQLNRGVHVSENTETKKEVIAGKIEALRRNEWPAVRDLLRFLSARLQETHVPEVASSMTLTTLLSIVPLLAVSLAIFSAFPSFADSRAALESMLFESFLPAQYSEVIVGYLRNFSEHASGLGAFGLIGLAVTSLMLINKLFTTINLIFGVHEPRAMAQRLLLYWALLTLGPMAVAFSLTVSTQVLSAAAQGIEAGILTNVLVYVQGALQTLAYALLFRLVPNCFVRFSHALAGGLFVVLANSLVRIGFEHYVSAGTMGNIYGAFVALPVLILWIYIGWYLVFMGAGVAATMPLLTSERFRDTYRAGNRFLTGVALLKVLFEERQAERAVVSIPTLCARVGTHPQMARDILSDLARAGYCMESASGPSDKSPDWTLVANPETTTLMGALNVLLLDAENKLIQGDAKKHADEGILEDWYASLVSSAALSAPLAVSLGAEGPAIPSEERVR